MPAVSSFHAKSDFCLFTLCRDDDIIESVLTSQDTQQDSDDSGFGTVQRGSTLSTVTSYVYINFIRFIYIRAKTTSPQMRLQRIQLNVYIEQRQRYKEKNRFRFRFKKEASPSSLFRLFIGGCCRVTLVVAFGFLAQNSGNWQGPTNGSSSFYGCRLSSGDTQLVATLKAYLLLLNSFVPFPLRGGGDAKMSSSCPSARRKRHLVKFLLPDIFVFDPVELGWGSCFSIGSILFLKNL